MPRTTPTSPLKPKAPPERIWGEKVKGTPGTVESPTKTISLLDTIAEKVQKESTLSLRLNRETGLEWDWNPEQLQIDMLLIECMVQRIPMMREALKDFRDMLQFAAPYPLTEKSAHILMQGHWLGFIEKHIERLEELAAFNLQPSTGKPEPIMPTVGKLDTAEEIKRLFDSILMMAHKTSAVVQATSQKNRERELISKENTAPLLPDIDPDCASDIFISAEQELRNKLPGAFSLSRTKEGRLRFASTQEWVSITQPGQEKRLLWVLHNGIVTALSNALTQVERQLQKLNPETNEIELIVSPDDYEAWQAAKKWLKSLKRKAKLYMEFLKIDDHNSFDEHFVRQLRTRSEIQKAISETPSKPKHLDRLVSLNRSLQVLHDDMATTAPTAPKMRADLLTELNACLDAFSTLSFNISINWEMDSPQSEEEPTPIPIPAYKDYSPWPWLPDNLSPQDLRTFPEIPK